LLFDAMAVLIASLTVATVTGPAVEIKNVPASPISTNTTPASMRGIELSTSPQQGAAAFATATATASASASGPATPPVGGELREPH